MKRMIFLLVTAMTCATAVPALAATGAAATAKSVATNAAKTAASNAAKKAAAPVLNQVNKVLNPVATVPTTSAPASTSTSSPVPSLPGITLPAILKPAVTTTTPAPTSTTTTVPATSSAPASTSASTPSTSPVATAAKSVFSVGNSSLGSLLDNPAAKAVLNKYIPGVIGNPQFSMMRGMTLSQLQPITGGLLSNDSLAKIGLELAGIK